MINTFELAYANYSHKMHLYKINDYAGKLTGPPAGETGAG